MLYKRHVFGETSKKCLSFFVGEFIAPEGSWEDDFRNLAFGMFFKVWKVKKTSIDWSRHGHNCAPVISEAIAISRRVGKILENRIEWKKPVGCLRLGNHLLPSDMKLNMGFINKPLEGILLLTMEGNKGVSFSILNWWHGEKIKTSCVFCFNPCIFFLAKLINPQTSDESRALLPSLELTSPTWGKWKSYSRVPFEGIC